MKMLTEIFDLDTFVAAIKHKDEMRVADIGHGMTSVCYMISAEGTFDNEWLRECRGIVFDKQIGTVVGRPLHKFFNLNEREESRADRIRWFDVVRVMDKRDGSMIHTVALDSGEMKLKSKKSFESDVAIAAQRLYDSKQNYVDFGRFLNGENLTAIFEYTAPDARIVLFYPEPELKLLHVRNNGTGRYMTPDELKWCHQSFGIPLVDEVDEFFELVPSPPGMETQGGPPCIWEFNVNKMLEVAKTREGVEGWIVQFSDGNMVKVKTEWYLKRHRAMTFLRERDIAQLVLDEGLDDLKSLLVGEGVDISHILKIEADVVGQLGHVRHWVEEVIAKDGKMPRKDFALQYQATHREHGWFGLLMTRFLGKEPDYKDWYAKHALKEKWSLRQLPMGASVAEAD